MIVTKAVMTTMTTRNKRQWLHHHLRNRHSLWQKQPMMTTTMVQMTPMVPYRRRRRLDQKNKMDRKNK